MSPRAHTIPSEYGELVCKELRPWVRRFTTFFSSSGPISDSANLAGETKLSVEKTVAGTADNVAGAIKAGGANVKQAAAKAHDLTTDPVVQAKARKLAEDGAKFYRAANSPEAGRACRQAADFFRKARKK